MKKLQLLLTLAILTFGFSDPVSAAKPHNAFKAPPLPPNAQTVNIPNQNSNAVKRNTGFLSADAPTMVLSERSAQRIKAQQMVNEAQARYENEKEEILAFSEANNMPIISYDKNGNKRQILGIINGTPIIAVSYNEESADSMSVDEINTGGSAGLSLMGSGVTLSIWDGGTALISHPAFNGRVVTDTVESSPRFSDHGTHVLGTMIANRISGFDIQGMAPSATAVSYDWDYFSVEMANHMAAETSQVSNHSWGFGNGWGDQEKGATGQFFKIWQGSSSESEDWKFGAYSIYSEDRDDLMHTNPYHLLVLSAGNDRNDTGPTSGNHYHLGDDTDSDPTHSDSHLNEIDIQYDTVGTTGIAKNVLTVAAVSKIIGGYTDEGDVIMSSFSGFGPADDGRIKPDIAAPGVSLTSAGVVGEDTPGIGTKSGTSMAAPSITGGIGLLLDHHDNLWPNPADKMLASTIKALVIHGADEAGDNPGPDYKHGWGFANFQTSAEIMSVNAANGGNELIREVRLNNGSTYTYDVVGSPNATLKATVVWTDKPGATSTAIDNTVPDLVNDLDLRIEKVSDATTYTPWVLDKDSPAGAATTADNSVDNVEQVVVNNAELTTYRITVTHKGTLSSPSYQDMSLIVTGIVGDTDLDDDGVPNAFDDYPTDNTRVVDVPAVLDPSNKLAMWLTASSNAVNVSGNNVIAWYDWSGNQRHATNSSATEQPSYVSSALNTLGAVDFDGTNDFMLLATPDAMSMLNSDFEVIMVIRSSSNATQFIMAGDSVTGELELSMNGPAGLRYSPVTTVNIDRGADSQYDDNNGHLFGIRSSGSSSHLYINGDGVTGNTSHSAATTNDRLRIGQREDGSSEFDGQISEILIFSEDLSNTERLAVFQYLDDKYALPFYYTPTPSLATDIAGITTTNTTPTISGTAIAGATLKIYEDGAEIHSSDIGTTTNVSNKVSFSIVPSTLPDGVHELSARTIFDGDVSAFSNTFNITIDTTTPDVPVFISPYDGEATNNQQPTINGTAEADAIVSIYKDDVIVATPTATGGNWAYKFPSNLGDGAHVFTAIATDGAGLNSATSSAVTLTIDTISPATPNITAPADLTATSDVRLPVVGTADANTIVHLYDAGAFVATQSVDGSGDWTYVPGSDWSDASHNIVALGADLAGNMTGSSNMREFLIDSTPPTAPAITSLPASTTTQNQLPSIGGEAFPDTLVTIYESDVFWATTNASSGGTFNVTATSNLAEGTFTFLARTEDALGNMSASSSAITYEVDISTPNAPVIVTPSDTEVTNNLRPVITGTGEADGLLSLYRDAVFWGTANVSGDGDWSFTPTSDLAEATYVITANVTDLADNVSTSSAPIAFTIDNSEPNTPEITAPTTGISTSNVRPEFTGTSDAQSILHLYNDGVLVGTTDLGGGSVWNFTPTSDISDGDHDFTAVAFDEGGNNSGTSNTVTITFDSTPPGAPVFINPIHNDATSELRPTVNGTSEANSLVRIYIDDAFWASADANGLGNWSITPTSDFAEGTYSFKGTAEDALGNVSATSAAVILSIDLTAPTKPIINIPVQGTTTGDATPFIVGNAEANSTVKVYHNDVLIRTVSTDGAGDFTATPNSSFSDGTVTVSVTATDLAGNVSATSDPVSFIVDTVAPVAPVISLPLQDDVTSNTTPTISGTAEASANITILQGLTQIATATADGSGDWSTVPDSVLTDGSYSIVARATDAGDNTGPSSVVRDFEVDTVSPNAPVFITPTDNTPVNDATPTISGTAEANSVLSIYLEDSFQATLNVDGGGAWTYTPTTDLAETTHNFTATVADAADNISPTSSVHRVVVDVTSPNVPVIALPTSDSYVNIARPDISGTAESGATVFVYVDDVLLGSTTANAGNYSFSPSTDLSDGARALTVQAQDSAGNLSLLSAVSTVNVDTDPPNAPVITSPNVDGVFNTNTPLIAGTAPASHNVYIYEGGVTIAAFVASADGSWSYTKAPAWTDGDHTISAKSRDDALNFSGDSNSVTLTIDTTAPVKPFITAPDDGEVTNNQFPVLEGTAEALATINIYLNDVQIGLSSADVSGDWNYTPTGAIAEGVHDIYITAVDVAENMSVSSDAIEITIDTTQPFAPVVIVPADGSRTNDQTPTVSGTGEAFAVLDLHINNVSVGSATADAIGDWVYVHGSSLGEAVYTVKARQTDRAGNTGPFSGDNTFTVDLTAPAAPAINNIHDDTRVADDTPEITGTGIANGVINLYADTELVATGDINGAGIWAVSPTDVMADATYNFTARAVEESGNISVTSNAVDVYVDTTAPVAPFIERPIDGSGTNDQTPTISGTAEANSDVEIEIDSVIVTTVTADGDGAWSHVPGSDLAEAVHQLRARATDTVGNTGSFTSIVTFTIDTNVPSAPVVTTPNSGVHTQDTTPTFIGTASANNAIAIYIDGSKVSTVNADGSGDWSYTPSVGLAEDTYVFHATATNIALLTGAASTPLTFTIDTTAPDQPTITSPVDGAATSNLTPSLTGTAEASTTINIYTTDTLVAQVTVDGSGNWSYTFGSPLAEDDYDLRVKNLDLAGNLSVFSDTHTLSVDQSGPDPISNMNATPGTGQIALTWSNPGTDYNRTLVLRKEDTFSSSTADGTEVFFAAGTSVTDTGLTSETEYFYSFYAEDEAGNFSTIATLSAFPTDTFGPATPSAFEVVRGDTSATLSWSNPVNDDFHSVQLRRSVSNNIDEVTDGTLVFSGTGEETTDTGLTNGITYFYGLFARDDQGNWTGPASLSVTPADVIAPSAPQNFQAAAGNFVVNLSWQNPDAADFQSVDIRRSTIAAPEQDEGVSVYTGNGTSFSDTTVAGGRTYFYSIFARDEVPNWSEAASQTAIPNSISAENFSVNGKLIVSGAQTTNQPVITFSLSYPTNYTASSGTINVFIMDAETDTAVYEHQITGALPDTISFTPSVALPQNKELYIMVTIDDNIGNLSEFTSSTFNTPSSTLSVSNMVMGPNPWTSGNLVFQYELTKAADVSLVVFTMAGERIWSKSLDAGEPGATAELNQELTWDGTNSFGEPIANGVYIAYMIIDDGSTKVKKKFKIAVLR